MVQLEGCWSIKEGSSALSGHKNGNTTDICRAKKLTRVFENSKKVAQKKDKLIL